MKALQKDTIREIKGSLGRFMAILLIVACGVGFFVGVKATAPSMKKTADQYFNHQSLYDFAVISTVGFDDDDVAAVRKIDKVDKVMLGYSADGLVAEGEHDSVLKILSLPDNGQDQVNAPYLVEGRLPEKETECVVALYPEDHAIGDTISVKKNAGDTNMDDVLKNRSFKVVGIVRMPQYIAATYGTASVGAGEVNSFILVPKSNFLYERYTEMYVTLKCHNEGISAFDPEYDTIINEVKDKLQNEVGIERQKAFLKKIAGAEGQLAQAKAQAEKELSAAEEELRNAYAQITDGELELSAGWKEYTQKKAEAEAEIASWQDQIDEGQERYAFYYGLYQSVQAAIDRLREEFPDIEHLDIYREYQAQMAQYAAELDAAKAEIEEGKVMIAQALAMAEQALAEAQAELYNGEDELNSAQTQYDAGLAEYNAAVLETEKRLSVEQNRIQNVKAQMGDVKSGMWHVFTRNDIMTNYSGFTSDAERIDAIANVFPVFFLLVAILVCMTTMSRMVDEQRLQMGTLKALGYKPREIIRKYVIYALSACLAGCLIGPVVCVEVLPRVIFNAYTLMYRIPDFTISIPWLMVIVSFVVAIASTLAVTLFACWKELRFTTAALMRPKAPKVGKEIILERIPFLWNRFSFFQKLTSRNLLRYKGRLIMTVIGIAGCMALVVAGFALDNAIMPIIGLQYGEVNRFDMMDYLNGSYSKDELAELDGKIKSDNRIDQSAYFVNVETTAYDTGQQREANHTYYCIPGDPSKLDTFIHLRDPDTKEQVPLGDDGAVITQKLAELLNLKVGDSLMINVNDRKITVNITGIAESYLYHYVYMTPAYYKKAVGTAPKYNCVFATQSEALTDQDGFINEWLKKDTKIATIVFSNTMEDRFTDIVGSLRMVIIVLIISAGLLAFIVLYNLTNINISERVREIATIKVLGFTGKETSSYVFRENIVMSILGILAGCVLGYILGHYIISMVEVDMVTYYHHIKLTSYLFGAGLTMIFTVLVNLFMTKRIKQVSMVESLKAVE